MPTIGVTTILPNSDTAGNNWANEATIGDPYIYTAVAGDVVTDFQIYQSNTTPGSADMTLYVMSGGIPTTRVAAPVKVDVGSTPGWYSKAVSIPLTAGVTYCVAISYSAYGGGWGPVYDSAPGNYTTWTDLGNGLADPWVFQGSYGFINAWFATVTPGASGPPEGAGSGAISWAGSAAGKAVVKGSASGAISWVGSANGEAPIPGMNEGSATGSISWVGTVTGTTSKRGSASGTVTWVGVAISPANVAWPSTISGRKILDQNGKPYYLRTFSSWGLASILNDSDRETAIDGVAANKFNGVSVWMGGTDLPPQGGWHQYFDSENRPFWTGTPWASSLGDGWLSVDHLMDYALSKGITVSFSFAGGFYSDAPGSDWENVTNSDMYNVGVAIATRYPKSSYPNLVWHIMLDSSHTPTSTRGQRIQSLFDGINDTEGPNARPVRWMEVGNGNTTDNQGWYLNGNFNATINCVYDYNGNSVELIETAYAQVSGPVGDCEPPYDGADHYSGNQGQQLRERSYSNAIEGAVLINYGQEDWWPFTAGHPLSEGLEWFDVPTHTHTIQQSYIWDLVDEYMLDPTWGPTDDFVTTGEESGETKVAQGRSDNVAIVYFPTARTTQVDTTILGNVWPVRLRWYDPTSGVYTNIATSESPQTARSISFPAARGDGTQDQVLVVDSLVPPNGTASGTVSWPGSATGVTTKKGSGSGNIAWIGTVVGASQHKGASVGAITWVGTASGVRVPKSVASGAISWGGVAVGGNLGVAVGAISWVGSAFGKKSVQGAVIGSISWVGTAEGFSPLAGVNYGAASGAVTWVGVVNGKTIPNGSANGAISWVGVAVGGRLGVAVGAINWVGTAAGFSPGIVVNGGSAVGSIGWDGSAQGSTQKFAAAFGAILWTGVVTSIIRVDPALFLLKPHVNGYKPEVIQGYKPRRRSL